MWRGFPEPAVIASVVGSLLLLLIGVAFLCAALVGWWRAGEDPWSCRRHLVAVVVDLLVGVTALGDGAVSVIGEPERVVVWSIGSAGLLVAVALLVARRRQGRDLHL